MKMLTLKIEIVFFKKFVVVVGKEMGGWYFNARKIKQGIREVKQHEVKKYGGITEVK